MTTNTLHADPHTAVGTTVILQRQTTLLFQIGHRVAIVFQDQFHANTALTLSQRVVNAVVEENQLENVPSLRLFRSHRAILKLGANHILVAKRQHSRQVLRERGYITTALLWLRRKAWKRNGRVVVMKNLVKSAQARIRDG